MDLRAVLRQCHWDWDLSDPQVRAAWDLGQIDRFYPPELGWPRDRPARPTASPARVGCPATAELTWPS
jgi:hypothetical protein